MKSFKFSFKNLNIVFVVFMANILFLSNSSYLDLDNLKYDLKNFLSITTADDITLLIFVSLLIALLYVVFLTYININLNIVFNFLIYIGTVSIVLSTLRINGFSRLFLIINLLIVPIYVTFFLDQINRFINTSTIIVFVISIFIINNLTFDNNENIDEVSVNSNLGIFDSYYVYLEPNGKSKVENFSLFQPHLMETNILEGKYLLERYSICCREYNTSNSGPPVRQKSVGYISIFGNTIFYLTGTGEIFYFDGNDIESKVINFNFIDSNFNKINKNKNIPISGQDFQGSWESTKDLMIIDNNIYLSYVNEPSSNCINTEILVAEINFEYLDFKPFFEDSECVIRTPQGETKEKPFNAHLAGGKMLYIPEKNSVLLSRGGFRNYERAQNKDSLLGKIILINIETRKISVPAMGTRNPQGLTLTKDGKYVLETEHGPNGGDEINLIDLNKEYINYGWPLSSYGDHWDPDYYDLHGEFAPLNKSHSEYGFEEPLVYFLQYSGGHGISDIDINFFSNNNNYFVATMNGKKLYDITFNEDHTEYLKIDAFSIGERIRDIEYYPNGNFYVLVFETTPAFGILKDY
ncbi:MAG: hypothetical protein CBE33_02125 [Candidatus Pelagibacter sp. TMED273]|nr:MAG: hypothetical protein CBE33_02125 [Candidatus Pelagibacter sp. TMED273]